MQSKLEFHMFQIGLLLSLFLLAFGLVTFNMSALVGAVLGGFFLFRIYKRRTRQVNVGGAKFDY